MVHDKPNIITELAPKGPRFVEIIEIYVVYVFGLTEHPLFFVFHDDVTIQRND